MHKTRGNKNVVEVKGSVGCGKDGSATTDDWNRMTIADSDRGRGRRESGEEDTI